MGYGVLKFMMLKISTVKAANVDQVTKSKVKQVVNIE